MHLSSYPSPSDPRISLPHVSMLLPPAASRSLIELARVHGGDSSAATPAFVMLGLDDRGKPHASRFGLADAEGVVRAASLMNFAAIRIDTDDLAKIAASLPPGKLFESGKAFVPFVKRETYDLLAAHLDDEFLTAMSTRVAAAANEQSYAEASKGEAPARLPDDWSKIAVGDRVLASDGPGDGWYEADVREVLPDGRFRLQWRDWPEIASFSREVTDIALLHPKHTGA